MRSKRLTRTKTPRQQLVSFLTEARKEEKRLKLINRDFDKQYSWDDWMRVSGYVSGLALARDLFRVDKKR